MGKVELDHAIDALQMRYIAALDSKKMHDWLACFDKGTDSTYICTAAENVEHGLELAFMYDDCYARLQDRVTYITEIWKGTFQDYRTRHFVQRIAVDPVGTDLYDVATNFSVMYTPEDTGQSAVLTAGIYRDRVRVRGGEAGFVSKKAIMDTSVVPRYLVYPL